jgi:DNA-binding transcriptional ArsR family regulator
MREIVLAACQFAEEFGRLEFFLSERDMALLAHVSRATVSRWLPDLGDWLTQTAAGSGRNAAGWRLHAPQHGPQLLQPPVPNTHGVCGPSWGPEADAFRHGGLGGNAKRLYFGPLAVGKPTARQAALELALAESTARSNLNRLEAAGLAERNDDGRWQRIAATPERWSVIALKLNRLGADSRQEARVIHERRARYERAAERYRRRAARYRRRGLRGFASYWECAARIEERAAERQAGQRGGAVDTVDQQRARTTIAGEIGRRSQQRRDNKWSD